MFDPSGLSRLNGSSTVLIWKECFILIHGQIQGLVLMTKHDGDIFDSITVTRNQDTSSWDIKRYFNRSVTDAERFNQYEFNDKNSHS